MRLDDGYGVSCHSVGDAIDRHVEYAVQKAGDLFVRMGVLGKYGPGGHIPVNDGCPLSMDKAAAEARHWLPRL